MARPTKAKKLTRGALSWITRRKNMAMKEAVKPETVTEAQLTRLAKGTHVATQWTFGDRAPQMGTQEIPGDGEIVGGYDDNLVGAIVHAARKRDGDGAEHIKRLIQIEQQKGRADGIAIERDRRIKLAEMERSCVSERIVCGFLAEVAETQRQHAGTIPYDLIWALNSLTLEKVVGALNAAGYRPEGKVYQAGE